MSMFTKTLLASSVAIAMTLTATSESVGTVTVSEGQKGAVVVTRGASTYSLTTGDPVFDGDRVGTRSTGKATITAYGCTQTLEPNSTVVVNGAFCGVEVTDLQADQVSPKPVQTAKSGGVSSGVVLGGLVAVVALAAVAGGGGGSDSGSSPTSP